MGRRKLWRQPRTKAEAQTQVAVVLLLLIGIPIWLVMKSCDSQPAVQPAEQRGFTPALPALAVGAPIDAGGPHHHHSAGHHPATHPRSR